MEEKVKVTERFGAAPFELSEYYHKARKNYCLYSALLIAGGLIGIDE